MTEIILTPEMVKQDQHCETIRKEKRDASDFATKLKIMMNLRDFKKAVREGDIDDYAPYIAHTPGITDPSDDVDHRRKWLISEGIAIEQIAAPATEAHQQPTG